MSAGRSELFISDLHLSPREPATAQCFLDFLAGPARDASYLAILGDLFDYWAGDDDLDDPFNARIVSALHGLASSGTGIGFLPGNRDFLIGERFAQAAGLSLLPDPSLRDICGIRTLLTHGDQLCTGDADYQHFRALVRAPTWQANFLARPLAERKREIEALRARSEHEKLIKPMAIMDVTPSAVTELLEAHGAQALIHGHTHRQGKHNHGTCIRWVLGDWHADRSSALHCAPGKWEFIA